LPRPVRALAAVWLALSILLSFLPASADDQEAAHHEVGRAIYNFRCYFCHGYSGDGRTLASTFLLPPPRDFTDSRSAKPGRDAMIATLRDGRAGTAMKSFARVLSAAEIEAVVDFVRNEFMTHGRTNTRYHTIENGWPNHDIHRAAFPFATGEVALDTPFEELDPELRQGKRLFLDTCISCHDRANVGSEGPVWERQALSYPRFGFEPGDILIPPDALSGASHFARHDIAPIVPGLTETAKQGERLFQQNCAFCHAGDGTGRNWIGTFLEPHPRDLTSEAAMAGMTRARLRTSILRGIPGTSMPAWRSVLEPSEVEAIIEYIDLALHPIATDPEAPAGDRRDTKH
jgi:cytochrome c oxidase cbb3-type subunit 3